VRRRGSHTPHFVDIRVTDGEVVSLTPPERSLVLISVRLLSKPQGLVWLEGLFTLINERCKSCNRCLDQITENIDHFD
jgi:hypothetical protein